MKNTTNGLWLDLTTSIEPNLVVWPGDLKVELHKNSTIEKDGYNLTNLSLSAHSGTHLDAPFHYLSDGLTIDKIDPNRLIGIVKVFEVKNSMISKDLLINLDIQTNDNIFFKTKNSSVEWQNLPFLHDYVCLDTKGAEYLVEKKINLVGIDYLSIGDQDSGSEVHIALLSAGILILEGLLLQNVDAGEYEMICLPIKIKGSDGAPTRVLVKKLS